MIDLFAPPHRGSHPPVNPIAMFCGTVAVKDIRKSKAFYEDMLGLQCAFNTPKRMFVRTDPALLAPGTTIRPWVLDVRETGEIPNPQRMLHHWGVDLATKQAVNEMHDRLIGNKEAYSIGTVFDATFQHGSYAFYFQDLDSNWWEFQYAPKQRHDSLFARGDVA